MLLPLSVHIYPSFKVKSLLIVDTCGYHGHFKPCHLCQMEYFKMIFFKILERVNMVGLCGASSSEVHLTQNKHDKATLHNMMKIYTDM